MTVHRTGRLTEWICGAFFHMICSGIRVAAPFHVRHFNVGDDSPKRHLARLHGCNFVIIAILAVVTLIVLTPSTSLATVTVGSEATLPLPSSALWHSIIGNQPADNSVQNLNPPVFKWLYNEDIPSTFGNAVRVFHFQLSTNPSFNPLYWNITCSNNFYNFVPPITNTDGSAYSGTIYWRILYFNADQTVNVGVGPTHNFTLSPNPMVWDRSMLADTNYLLGIATNHPHMWFNQANLGPMSTFLRTSIWPTYGKGWSTVTNNAAYYQGQAWWNKSTIVALPASRWEWPKESKAWHAPTT
jgi:hypothetical protein